MHMRWKDIMHKIMQTELGLSNIWPLMNKQNCNRKTMFIVYIVSQKQN